jgi:hypothetical protein
MKKPTLTNRMLESDEFQARQLAFDFGHVARAVASIVGAMRKKLARWVWNFVSDAPAVRPAWVQLAFEGMRA